MCFFYVLTGALSNMDTPTTTNSKLTLNSVGSGVDEILIVQFVVLFTFLVEFLFTIIMISLIELYIHGGVNQMPAPKQSL